MQARDCMSADALTKIVLFAAPQLAERALAVCDARAFIHRRQQPPNWFAPADRQLPGLPCVARRRPCGDGAVRVTVREPARPGVCPARRATMAIRCQSNQPMQRTGYGALPVIDEVIKSIAAQRQHADHENDGKATVTVDALPPVLNDVPRQQCTEHHQKSDHGRAVQAHPPGLRRVRAGAQGVPVLNR